MIPRYSRSGVLVKGRCSRNFRGEKYANSKNVSYADFLRRLLDIDAMSSSETKLSSFRKDLTTSSVDMASRSCLVVSFAGEKAMN